MPTIVMMMTIVSKSVVASVRILTSGNRRTENVCVVSVVIAELELGNIERHVFPADLVEGADHAAFEDRPEASIVCVCTAPMTYWPLAWSITAGG
jgi:hypothetical protein